MAHLVWDWNGTLLDDITLVVAATNASLASIGGPAITTAEHRRDFRRPISAYYEYVLGRALIVGEFAALDKAFHDEYRLGLAQVQLAADAQQAIAAWTGSQSLLSMFFHDELLPAVSARGLDPHLSRVDGLRDTLGGGPKAPYLEAHLAALGLPGSDCVLIGDSVDDAHAAAAVGAAAVLYTGGFTHEDHLWASGYPVATTLVDAVTIAIEVGAARVG